MRRKTRSPRNIILKVLINFIIFIATDRDKQEYHKFIHETKSKLREKLRKHRLQNKSGASSHLLEGEALNYSKSHPRVEKDQQEHLPVMDHKKDDVRLPRFKKHIETNQNQLSNKYKNSESLSNNRFKKNSLVKQSPEETHNRKLRQAQFELK